MVKPILTVKLEGDEVEGGRIPVNELALVLKSIQLSVKRIGQVIAEGQSHSTSGRHKAKIDNEYGLDVVAFEPGSFVTGLVPHSYGASQQTLIESAGEAAMRMLVDGVGTIKLEPETLVKAFDIGVLSALSAISPVFDRGINGVVLSYNDAYSPSTGPFSSISSTLDRQVATTINRKLGETLIPNHRISGVLREVNFEHNTCQIYVKRQPVSCSFPLNLKDDILKAIEMPVTVYGEAKLLGSSGRNIKIKVMDIQAIEVAEVSQPSAVTTDILQAGQLQAGSPTYNSISAEELLSSGLFGVLQEYAAEIGDSVDFIRGSR